MHTQEPLQALRTWQQVLLNLQQENAMLKIKLSELVDNSIMSDFLNKAEFLHAEFISNDESLSILLDSINHLSTEVTAKNVADPKNARNKIESAAADIRKFQKRFAALTNRFYREFAEG